MNQSLSSLTYAWKAMGEALVIALIIGIQRESDSEERHAGIRDFLLIGLAGGICGLLQSNALTVSVLAALTALLLVFRIQTPGRTGITTEFAAVGAFLLALLAADSRIPFGETLAIGLTILVAFFLKARDALRKLAREEITGAEFSDTLLFLAVVFVVYPVLPAGAFGPFGFFNPRRIWMFVILVSSITYLGYFLQKFLGPRRGLRLTGILGGMASTTAATLSFARNCRDDPAHLADYAGATAVANAVQFPRLALLLAVISLPLFHDTAAVLAMMSLTGLVAGWLMTREPRAESIHVPVGNPFQFASALRMGALFALILYVVRALSERAGTGAVYVSSAAGGSIDLDAVVLSMADLLAAGKASGPVVIGCLALAVASNAVLKTGIAFFVGGVRFGARLLAAFAAMFATGALLAWIVW